MREFIDAEMEFADVQNNAETTGSAPAVPGTYANSQAEYAEAFFCTEKKEPRRAPLVWRSKRSCASGMATAGPRGDEKTDFSPKHHGAAYRAGFYPTLLTSAKVARTSWRRTPPG
jgi:hypothetical protein